MPADTKSPDPGTADAKTALIQNLRSETTPEKTGHETTFMRDLFDAEYGEHEQN
jgi:hypothetical protein